MIPRVNKHRDIHIIDIKRSPAYSRIHHTTVFPEAPCGIRPRHVIQVAHYNCRLVRLLYFLSNDEDLRIALIGGCARLWWNRMKTMQVKFLTRRKNDGRKKRWDLFIN